MDTAQQQTWITDFGQKVDLTARLREILLNYPEGTSILKELVQVTLLQHATHQATASALHLHN
jgi:hypothetical protein